MRRFSILPVVAAGFALAAPACAAPASPAKVERIVAFGDSYADNGNMFRLAGAVPPPMYPKGRFSDGTNFVDTMGSILKVPIVNFALGGAVTGAGDSDFRPAGLDVQTRAFLSGRGPLGFPRTGGRFAPGDLAVISIGGNDARRYSKSFGKAPGPRQVEAAVAAAPAAADRSVANAAAALDLLAAAGARNVCSSAAMSAGCRRSKAPRPPRSAPLSRPVTIRGCARRLRGCRPGESPPVMSTSTRSATGSRPIRRPTA
jgi:phospholipase/lecithinase/hemolysin